MKKTLQTLLIIISFLFVSGVNAKTTYNNTPDFSNDYIKHYKDYTRYLVTTDSPYGYDSGIVAYDDDYKTGGLLNEYEFNISKDTTGNTYLFNGLEYWTMTKSGSGMRFIDPSVASYLNTRSKNLLSGIRVTNYVQNGIYLRGSGTINDPWTFIEKYYVRFVYDDTKVTITPQVIMVPNEGTAIVTVTNSTNYEYAGNDCNGTYNSSTGKLTISNIKKDTTCNITTALKEHTITYTPSGLCTPTTKKVKHTRAMGTLCSPTKTGYTFKGWYEGGVQVNENTEVLSDMTIEAKFEANKYTLTYDNNNGTGCTSKEGTYDQTWGSLCTPTRTGYTFKGWYTSLSGGTKFEATEKVAGNKTVYARWEGNKFTVAYNGNGSTSGSVDSHECTYDGTCTLKANGFTKTGYTFVGWKKANTGDTIAAGGSIKNAATSGTVTYYAQWTANKFTVAYNGNGSTSGSVDSHECTYDGTCTLKANGFAKTGYTFAGWKKANTGDTIAAGTSIKNAATSGTVTYYAQWTANTYTVAYNSNSGTGTMDSSTATYNSNFVTRKNTFTRTGYTFNGWNESANGSGTKWALNSAGVYENGNGTNPWKWTYTKDITLYAQWNANKFTVAYNGNGSTSGSVDSHECTYDGTCTLKANGFAKTGYTFVGWKKANTGDTIAAGTSIKNVATSGTVTYYAQWTINSNKLTVNPNGGSVTFDGSARTTSTSVTKNYNTTIAVPNATRSNSVDTSSKYTVSYDSHGGSAASDASATITKTTTYTFSGWTDSGTCGTMSGTTYTFPSNSGTTCTKTAGWTSSTSSSTAQVTLPTVTRTGYTFNGWYTAASGGTKAGGAGAKYTPTANITLHAQWTEKTATLTYNANGHGTAPSAVTMKYTTATNAASAITATGYTFSKWCTKSDGSGTCYNAGAEVKAANKEPSATTLYAIWTINSNTLKVNPNGGSVVFNNNTLTGTGSVTKNYNTTIAVPNATRSNSVDTSSKYTVSYNSHGGSAATAANATITKTTTYTFSGWTNSGTCGTMSGTTYTFPSNSGTTCTKTAGWTSSTTSSTAQVTLPTITRSGYAFLGWYTAESGGTKIGDGGAKYTPTQNITLHAQWKANYAIAFSYTGKFKVGSTEYTNTSYNTNSTPWQVEFLTSGTLNITALSTNVDAYVVGGGGGGGGAGRTATMTTGSYAGAGGGGGGAAKKVTNFALSLNTNYTITIGAGGTGAQSQAEDGSAGGTSSLGSLITAAGGSGGSKCGSIDANAAGGTGGTTVGGSLSGTTVNGAKGGNGGCRNNCTHYNGIGYKGEDGASGTAAFGSGSTLYGAGGGGGAHSWANGNSACSGAGGSTGGGAGGVSTTGGGYANHGSNATANTGSGGGGASGGGCTSSFPTCGHGGSGGSGIVIIRNKR